MKKLISFILSLAMIGNILRYFASALLLISICFNLPRPIRLTFGLVATGIICVTGVLQYLLLWREERTAINKWKLLLFTGFSLICLCLVIGSYFWLT